MAASLSAHSNWFSSPQGLRQRQPHFRHRLSSSPLLPSILPYLLLLWSEDNIQPAPCLDKLMLRCQPWFWCIPPALASGWPRTPAPTAETFQCFSGMCLHCSRLPCSPSLFHHSRQWWVSVLESNRQLHVLCGLYPKSRTQEHHCHQKRGFKM